MTRVYIGHLRDASQWTEMRTNVARVAKIQSYTGLLASALSGYHYAFLVMQTHEDAQSVLRVIGREKMQMDAGYMAYEPRVYAEWARPKNKKKK